LYGLAKLCLWVGGTVHLHETDAFRVRVLGAVSRRDLKKCKNKDEGQSQQLGHIGRKALPNSGGIFS
jgi:hypothetical protein